MNRSYSIGKKLNLYHHFMIVLVICQKSSEVFKLNCGFLEYVPKKQSKEKSVVYKQTKGGKWELVYVETENEIILIHIKLRR